MMNKPRRNYVYIDMYEGHYDFLHPNETQYQYVFHNLPDGLQSMYIVKKDVDCDDDSVIDAAREIKVIIEKYLYNSDKEKIAKVVNWLEEHEDEQYRILLEYKIASDEWIITEAQERLDKNKKYLEVL